ncbi:MAG: AEC family transporter [Emcibacter sp.]|nr:AEC family transporter [Emcibacter sp.]
MISELFNIVSPVFFIALIGYLWVKQGYDFPTDFVTRINMNIGAPCLVFTGMMTLGDGLLEAGSFLAATLVSIIALMAISTLFALAFKLPARAYIVSLYSTNSGNMGIPLCLFAFGQEGMSLAIAYFALSAMFQFTVALFISHGNLSASSLTRVSMIYGIAAAAFFILGDIEAPKWLMNTTELMAGVTIPLMLLTLGASLARLKLENSGRMVLISAFKIAMGLSIGFAISTLFGFTGVERNVLIMQSSMPVAIFSYLLATQYNRSPNDVATMIFITTLMSFITVPLLLTYLI